MSSFMIFGTAVVLAITVGYVGTKVADKFFRGVEDLNDEGIGFAKIDFGPLINECTPVKKSTETI